MQNDRVACAGVRFRTQDIALEFSFGWQVDRPTTSFVVQYDLVPGLWGSISGPGVGEVRINYVLVVSGSRTPLTAPPHGRLVAIKCSSVQMSNRAISRKSTQVQA